MKYVVFRTDGTEIPDDEPCFVLRAKDMFTPETVRFYISLVTRNGTSSEFIKDLHDHLSKIEKYQWEHHDLVKYPD